MSCCLYVISQLVPRAPFSAAEGEKGASVKFSKPIDLTRSLRGNLLRYRLFPSREPPSHASSSTTVRFQIRLVVSVFFFKKCSRSFQIEELSGGDGSCSQVTPEEKGNSAKSLGF